MRPRPSAVFGLLGVAVCAISAAALLIRLSHAHPFTIAAWRLGYAALLALPASVPALRARGGLRGVAGPVVLAGACLAVHFASWIASMAPASPYATSVAASATLVASHPVIVALATPWLTGRSVPTLARWGVGAALLGACVIALGDASAGHHQLAGDALAALGAVAGAGYFLAGARARRTLSLLAYVGPVYAIAAVLLALLAVAAHAPLMVTSPREHALFVGMALGPMLLGHTLLNWALRYGPAWVVSAAILAEPVASVVLVGVVLREAPPAAAVMGAMLVLAGLGLIAGAARGEGR